MGLATDACGSVRKKKKKKRKAKKKKERGKKGKGGEICEILTNKPEPISELLAEQR